MISSIYGAAGAITLGLVSLVPSVAEGQSPPQMASDLTVHRFAENPIITPESSPGIGINIQGPSLIRVPSGIPNPLGNYYLYFADHKGSYIRLAYADELAGPWTVHEPGTLYLERSHFSTEPARVPDQVQKEISLGGWAPGPVEGVPGRLESATKPHLASPDVHVREDRREIVMYFHGLADFRFQRTRVATSKDGIHFEAREPLVSGSYHRGFQHQGQWYAMSMPGIFYRSKDGISDFETSDLRLFPSTMRPSALLKRGDLLYVFWSRVGDTPEHIMLSKGGYQRRLVHVVGQGSSERALPRGVMGGRRSSVGTVGPRRDQRSRESASRPRDFRGGWADLSPLLGRRGGGDRDR